MTNPANSISQFKRLIGKPFSDPELQKDIKTVPFSVIEGPDGFPMIRAWSWNEPKYFTPTQVLGMMFSNMKGIAEKNLNTAVVDCCIGIPVYFTDLQRRAVMDAATIAGLRPLRLIHETTAAALAYGIYKTDLPETDPLNVAFVDIGHASMQVCIAGFKKGQLKVLAHSFDQSLGGRDFDEGLFQHFAAKFKDEYKIDVLKSARACLRLRAACEKMKKVLSANAEAPLNIECLMEEKDVRGYIKRDEFEQISIPILERVKKPLEKALQDAQLAIDNIHMVELVGSGSRVPAIINILTEFFGKEPRLTMNASECVARGCTLQCAILSPTFKVREFQVHESFPFYIAASWKGAALDSQDGKADNQQSSVVFPKGNAIPSVKALTFYRSGTFTIDLLYADAGELPVPAKISTYTIGPFQSSTSERAKVKVKAHLNLHGIVSVDSAMLIEEEEVEIPVTKEPAKDATKMETEAPNDAAPPSSNDADVNMQDARETADASGAENGVPDSGDKPTQMETDNKVEAPKRKVMKTNLPVAEVVYGAMAPADVQKAVEKEFEMALQDRVIQETKDKRNAVESYVYVMRTKLTEKYQEFVTDSERKEFIRKLQEVEDWLYEDGKNTTKGVYADELEELKERGDPIEERYKEYTERGSVVEQLIYCINSYREAAVSNDLKFDHIDLSVKQKVLNECVEADAWLREKKQQQDSLSKYVSPVLLSADVRKKAEAVDRVCKQIMMKPKPAKPATPETSVAGPIWAEGGYRLKRQRAEDYNFFENKHHEDAADMEEDVRDYDNFILKAEEDEDLPKEQAEEQKTDMEEDLDLDTMWEERKCPLRGVCDFAHWRSFDELPCLLDIYSIILRPNENFTGRENLCLRGKLSGTIFTEVIKIPDEIAESFLMRKHYVHREDLYLYKMKKDDTEAESVDLSADDARAEITLFGPHLRRFPHCEISMILDVGLRLDDQELIQGEEVDSFDAFKDGDKFNKGTLFFHELRFRMFPWLMNRVLHEQVRPIKTWGMTFDDDGPVDVFVRYAIMSPGAAAGIKIKILNRPDVSRVHGCVYARPCSFIGKIPLIRAEEAGVEPDGTIQLKRSLVAVPSNASLVIGVDQLCDQHGRLVVSAAATFFVPLHVGRSQPKLIGDSCLQVEVEWLLHDIFPRRWRY
ncbi:heat shock 70 kDa protein 15-like isoform X2 [Mercurialis annua]|nr:heat shock 70 kDa protein 15-like isoform X2 [Mercurialis annua]